MWIFCWCQAFIVPAYCQLLYAYFMCIWPCVVANNSVLDFFICFQNVWFLQHPWYVIFMSTRIIRKPLVEPMFLCLYRYLFVLLYCCLYCCLKSRLWLKIVKKSFRVLIFSEVYLEVVEGDKWKEFGYFALCCHIYVTVNDHSEVDQHSTVQCMICTWCTTVHDLCYSTWFVL